MPDVCYLLYSLGMTRDRRSLKVWQRVVDILDPREDEYKEMTRSPFHYVDAVCFGAERLGDPAAIPIFNKLHAYPCLRNHVDRDGFQPDYLKERQAMNELSIGKALSRCGSSEGTALVIDYLDDSRTTLAEQAHSHLVRISGSDHGKEGQAWKAWLADVKGSWRPQPLLEDLDAVYDQAILTE